MANWELRIHYVLPWLIQNSAVVIPHSETTTFLLLGLGPEPFLLSFCQSTFQIDAWIKAEQSWIQPLSVTNTNARNGSLKIHCQRFVWVGVKAKWSEFQEETHPCSFIWALRWCGRRWKWNTIQHKYKYTTPTLPNTEAFSSFTDSYLSHLLLPNGSPMQQK